MANETERRTLLKESAHRKIDNLLDGESHRILVMHVPEKHYGCACIVMETLERREACVYDLNPAYVDNPVERMAGGEPIDAVLPIRVRGNGVPVVWVSGWGSQPSKADELLTSLTSFMRLSALLADGPDLRIVVLNNASPIPPGWPEHGPAAWPDAESFAAHVAGITGIERLQIDVWPPEGWDEESLAGSG